MVSDLNHYQIESFAATMLDDIGIDKVVYKQDIYGEIGIDDPSVSGRLESVRQRYGKRVDARMDDISGSPADPCVVPYIKVAFNPYGELYSCCLGAQPGEKNGVMLGSLASSGSFERLWFDSAPIRKSMLMPGVSCSHCNYTDRAINQIHRSRLADTASPPSANT